MEKPASSSISQNPSDLQRFLISLFRSFFHLLYHQFAWTYDWVASIVSLGAWQRWGRAVLPYLNNTRTLEIGFGPGHLQLALHQQGFDALGLDESLQMSRICRRRLLREGFSPRLVRGNALSLPFASGSFQQVVMTFPADFLLKNDAFTEVKRILISGGEVLIIPIAWITGRKPLERLLACLNRLTGEAPAWNEKVLEPLKKLGFDLTWHMIHFESSQVLLIRMEKPLIPDQD